MRRRILRRPVAADLEQDGAIRASRWRRTGG
jgi:hypothetical protein